MTITTALKSSSFTAIEPGKKSKAFQLEDCGYFLSLTIRYAGKRKCGEAMLPNTVEHKERLEKLVEKLSSSDGFTQALFCSCGEEIFLFRVFGKEKELYISYYETAGRSLRRIPAEIVLDGNERARLAEFLKMYIDTHTFIDRDKLED